jgi:P-type Cu+ transporter
MERLADRASAIFVPVVLGLAPSLCRLAHRRALAAPWPGQHRRRAGDRLPLRHGAGRARRAHRGRGPRRAARRALQRRRSAGAPAHLDAIVLDKTGTLTVGRPVLEAFIRSRPRHTENDLLRMAAAAEERSNHPLAHAVVDAARGTRPHLAARRRRADSARPRPYRHSRRPRCLLGNEALFKEFSASRFPIGIAPPEPGVTRLWMALDNMPAGYFDARDALRPDAAEAIAALRRSGPARADADRRLSRRRRAHRPTSRNHRGRSRPRPGRQAGPHSRPASRAACAWPWWATASTTQPRWPRPTPASPWVPGADLAQEAGDVLLLRAQPSAIPAALAWPATLRVMRQNLIWARLQPARHSPGRRRALPGFPHSAHPWLAAAAMASAPSACWQQPAPAGWLANARGRSQSPAMKSHARTGPAR